MFDIEQSDLVLGRKILAFGGGVLEAGESIGQRTAAVNVQVINGARLRAEATGLPRDDDVPVPELEMTTLKQPFEGPVRIRL